MKLKFIFLLTLSVVCSSLKNSSANDDLYYSSSNKQLENKEVVGTLFIDKYESTIFSNDSSLFEFKFKKAVNKTKGSFTNKPYNITAGKGSKKIQIRFKIKSKSGLEEQFDPNGFYLVSENQKLRYRPIDIQHYFALYYFIGFKRLVNDSSFANKKNEYFSYNPDIRDIFEDYKIDSYEDVEQRINFVTNRKLFSIVAYFKPKMIRSKIVDVYFIVPKEFVNGKIYYKGKSLKEFELTRYSL